MKTHVKPDGGVALNASSETLRKKLKSVFAGEKQQSTNSFYHRIVEEMKSGRPLIFILHDSMCHPDDNPELKDYPNAAFYFVFELTDVADQLLHIHKIAAKARTANPSITLPKIILAINNPTALCYVENQLEFRSATLASAAALADEIFVTMDIKQLQEKV